MSTEDLPDFLGGEAAPETSAPEAAAAPATPETAAPAAEAPQTTPLAEPALGQPPPVPLATFLDLRDRLSAKEKEAKELREWREQQEAQARRQPPPDRATNPDAYERHREAQFNGQIHDQRLTFSRQIAELKHGEDVVAKAYDWAHQRCDQDQYFNAKVAASTDPLNFVVAEWKREQTLAQVTPEELDAFQQWKAANAGAAQPAHQPAAAPAAPARPAAPRPSLASGPSAGSVAAPVPRDKAATFDAMFPT